MVAWVSRFALGAAMLAAPATARAHATTFAMYSKYEATVSGSDIAFVFALDKRAVLQLVEREVAPGAVGGGGGRQRRHARARQVHLRRHARPRTALHGAGAGRAGPAARGRRSGGRRAPAGDAVALRRPRHPAHPQRLRSPAVHPHAHAGG